MVEEWSFNIKQYKTCSKCKQTQPIDLFGKDKSRKDGVFSYCKTCSRLVANAHYHKNAELINQRQAAAKAKNKDKYRQASRDYYKRNSNLCRQRISNWQTRNQNKVMEYAHLRRIRIEQSSFLVTNLEVKKLRSGLCFYCKTKPAKTLDHVIPLSRGGYHGIGNLVGACKSCNSSKNDKFIMEWRLTKLL